MKRCLKEVGQFQLSQQNLDSEYPETECPFLKRFKIQKKEWERNFHLDEVKESFC